MKKSIQKLLILLVTLLGTASMHAYDFVTDGIYYNILSSTEAEVTFRDYDYNTYSGAIVIPSAVSYNGTSFSVIRIGSEAFSRCSGLTSVTIPNSVTSIGYSAFADCHSLNSVDIPNSVTLIGGNAFDNTALYENASNWENGVLYIGKHLIKANSNQLLKEYVIKDGTLTLAMSAFSFCRRLTSVTIPNSVTSIGDGAFSTCTSLNSVDIPNSVTSIGDSAFAECYSLTSLTIPNSVTSIGECTFYDCTILNSVDIPNSVTSIGYNAFSCTALYNNEANWEDGVLYIGKHLIEGRYGSVNVVIKEGTLTVAGAAFKDCTSLISVTIPNSVISIGDWAFYGCTSLTSVAIPDSVTSIGNYSFCGCSAITSLTLPNLLTSIGDFTFNKCGSITSVTIPNSVTKIGDWAFGYCRRLASVDFSNSLTWIGAQAFFECSALASVNLPNSVTWIGNDAFSLCSNLTSVIIPNSVAWIGNTAFCLCSRLNSVTVKNDDPSKIILGEDVFGSSPVSTATLSVPIGSAALYEAADQWKAFGTIDVFGTTIELVDGQPYTGASDIQDVDINYTRNFKSTNWQGLYIPFDMSYEEWEPYATVAELAGVHMYDDDNDGTPDRTNIEFATVTSGKLIPNVPYLIKPKAVANVTFQCTTKNLKAAPEVDGSVYSCTPRWKYSLIGTYTNRTDLVEPNIYSLGQGKFRPNNADVPPFRFYLEMTKQQGGYWGAPGKDQFPTEIEISVDGNTLSGIAEIFIDSMPDCADDNYYDLQGRKVENPSGGIFIHKGKLLLFK